MNVEMIEPTQTNPNLSKVAVYNPIEAGIALLMEKHGSVLTTPPDVSTSTAMDVAKKNRTEMVKFRTAIEAARVKEKAESLAYGKLVDSEAKRITAIAAPIELAYDTAITKEEARLEAIRQAAIEAERQRIAGHRARIQTIKDVRETALLCRTSDRLKQLIDGMPARMEPTFEEFQDEALTAFNEVCTVLGQLHTAKVVQEQAAAELARQQAELAQQRAEQERIDREARELREQQEAQAQAKRESDAAEIRRRASEVTRREQEVAQREAASLNNQVQDDVKKARAIGVLPIEILDQISDTAQFLADSFGVRQELMGQAVESIHPTDDRTGPSEGEMIAVAVQAVAGHFGMTPDEALIRLSEIAEWRPLQVA